MIDKIEKDAARDKLAGYQRVYTERAGSGHVRPVLMGVKKMPEKEFFSLERLTEITGMDEKGVRQRVNNKVSWDGLIKPKLRQTRLINADVIIEVVTEHGFACFQLTEKVTGMQRNHWDSSAKYLRFRQGPVRIGTEVLANRIVLFDRCSERNWQALYEDWWAAEFAVKPVKRAKVPDVIDVSRHIRRNNMAMPWAPVGAWL